MESDIRADVAAALDAAERARAKAYAPHSEFKMGTAVITDQDEIIPGSLVENVSLGLAMCSEQVALFSTVTNSAGRPKVLVLRSPRTDGKLTWPCGACLQVARELGGSDMMIVASDGSRIETAKLSDLAPRLPAKS
ncbi:MAG: cytidine deaminase [Rhizobiales bacterium]|nr:cytidine deaminase [Hyphomicrobiales bacterium]